jgi:fibronectin type 3 domain-containing protein
VSFVSNATNSPANVTLSGSGGAVGAHTVSLTWVASPTANVNYKVYRGTASGGPYTVLTSSPVSGTSYTDSNGVVSGLTYYYVVTAVDGTGSESTYSNQATAVIPNP